MSLKIFRDSYVLLPRAGITLKLFRGRYVLVHRACMPLKILACISSRITTVIQITVHQLRKNALLMRHLRLHFNVASLRNAWRNLLDNHMTTGRNNQGTVTVLRDPHRTRPKADVRNVAMSVNLFSGQRTARCSPLSQSLVLLKYQMHRREPRCERVARRNLSGTRPLRDGRTRVSASGSASHCGGGHDK